MIDELIGVLHIFAIREHQGTKALIVGIPIMDTTEIRVNAVAYREGDAWVIQGIDYDIVAFSKSVDDLLPAFARTVIDNIRVTEHLGRAPLEGVKPAPARFQEMFKNAQSELRSVRPSGRTNVTVRLSDATC